MRKTPQIQCRICLKNTDNILNIYESYLSGTETLIFEFLKRLTNLEIAQSDNITQFICGLCSDNLHEAYQLIQQCVASYHQLQSQPPQAKCETTKTDEMYNKHVCKLCDKEFAYAYLLKQHEFKHLDKKPFPCTECSKGCLTAESLRRHMRIHDKDYAKKKHTCKICTKEFAYPSFLAEHMKNHTGEKPHLCSICGKGFRQSGALHYHQRVHTGYKPFSCSICKGNFMSQSVLKLHMRKHTNERPYVCHICGMAFRQSRDLKSHHRTHSGEKPVLCTICGKRMFTTGQLTIHIRSHTGEKPFVCSYCPKAFTTKTMLVKHERIHTGERPYLCDICGRAFNQSSTLKTHRKRHNKLKNGKEFADGVEIETVAEVIITPDDSSGGDNEEKDVKDDFQVELPLDQL